MGQALAARLPWGAHMAHGIQPTGSHWPAQPLIPHSSAFMGW